VSAAGTLRGAVALVTGGASGIGAATTARLRAAGMRVAVADLREPAAGTADLAIVADVAEPEAWPSIVARVTGELGGLDAVHLNAGVTCNIAGIADVDDAAYRRLMRVNVDHVFFGLRACLPAFEAAGGGRVVVTASLAGLTAFPVDPVYTLTKHAVVGLVRGCADGLAARRVVVCAVCPGIVDTPLLGSDRDILVGAGFPLLDADDVAVAVERALIEGRPGECWYVQPGREPAPYRFAGVPGPRGAGKEGMLPPL
jgi:NAD(P)-dependent dehydrogenase (short-subunit alcohol dehydrogenase family)